MIDAHLHVVPPNLPGVGPLSAGLRAHPDNVARVVREQMLAAGVTKGAAMGSWDSPPDDPLGVKRTLQVAERLPGLFAIGVADHRKTDREHLRGVDAQLADRRIVALKAYLGYVYAYPNDPGYLPYYELAQKHKIPFFFHTGDPYSPYAKLKFAMPVHVDEVAVDFPDVKFVLAHVGNPWMVEAAEVVYKNMNVWADLSGLLIGEEEQLLSEEGRATRQDVINRVRAAMRYAERPNRFLYGSDWPLAPMNAYAGFVREAVLPEFHEQVFEGNARILFGPRLGQ
ncbi:amidohydrolase family protein [Zavarzinella formosa]|uniref:amidohydrolase family protein n=1 Tax=Zavarzinella formosa TaxID=360055 RepID=UPI0002F3BF34|nr:amidohydrolase family protein [Zavarzinella formosa]